MFLSGCYKFDMRAVILLLAVGLAASNLVDSEIGWRPGTEYVFRYDSQVLTGIPTTSTQYSGLKILCDVRCQVTPEYEVIMKLEDIKVLMLNDIVTSFSPTEPIPESVFTLLPDEEARIFKDNLPLPVSFKIEQGYISEVKASENEPTFTVNIKKGIINLFQVNLGQRSHLEDLSSHRINYMDYSRQFRESPDTSFRVMEPGVCGTCESIYTLIPNIESSAGVPIIMLSKVRNYLNCLKKPVWENGLLAGVGHGIKITEQMEKPLLKAYTHTNYLLNGDRTNFVIKKALTNSKFVYTPYRENGGSVTAFILQQLELENVLPSPNPITPLTQLIPEPNGLLLAIANPMLRQELRPTPEPTFRRRDLNSERIRVIENLIEIVIAKTDPVIDFEVSATVNRLILALTECTAEELLVICKKYISVGTPWMEKRKELLLGILPILNTPEVAPVIVKIVKQNITGLPNVRPAMLLTQMALTIPPTPSVVMELLNLCTDPEIQREDVDLAEVWRPAMLGLGAVTYKMVKLCEATAIPKSVIMPAVSAVIQTIEELLDERVNPTLSLDQKITILKAIGNSGLPDFLPVLTSTIKSNRGPKALQIQAVHALRRIAPVVPRQVQSLLLPIFLDPRRPYDERIAAFIVLMDANPKFGVLQVICHSLHTETNLQVGSFVYSYLNTLSTSTNPALWTLAQNARLCLVSARPISLGIRYSKGYHLDIYSELLNQAAGLDLFMINSPSTILPKSIVAKLNLTASAQNTDLLEMGIDTEGLETLVRKLVGPYGILKNILKRDSSILDILEPSIKPLWGDVGDEMKRILRKISIKERPMEDFSGSMHLKVFGHEVRYWTLNANTMGTLERSSMSFLESMLAGRKEIDLLEIFPMGESCLLLPTPIGIPVSLNMSAHTLVRLKGSLEVSGMPSISQIMSGRLMPEEVKVTTDIIASTVTHYMGKLGVVTPPVTMGTGLNGRFLLQKPFKTEIGVNLREVKLSIKYAPPTEEMIMYRHKYSPITFSRLTPPTIIPEVCKWQEKEIINRTIIATISNETSIVSPLLDTTIRRVCHKSRRLAAWAPYSPMTGPGDCIHTLIPSSRSAREVNVEIVKRREPEPFAPNVRGRRVRQRQSGEESSWFSGIFNYDSSEEQLDTSIYPVPVVADPCLGTSPRFFIYELKAETDTSKSYHVKLHTMWSDDYYGMQYNLQVVGNPVFEINPIYRTIDIPDAKHKMNIELLMNMRPLTCLYSMTEPQRPRTPILRILYQSGIASVAENKVKLEFVSDSPRSEPVHWAITANPDVDVCSINGELEIKTPSRSIKKVLQYMTHMVIGQVYPHIYMRPVDIPSLPIPTPTQTLLKLHIVPQMRRGILFVKTPIEVDYEIMLPLVCPFMEPLTLSVEPPLDISPLTPLLGGKKPTFSGECKLIDDKVMTFDTVTYPLPELSPECEVILTKDCSPHSIFTVLATLPRRASERKIKLLMPSHHIEILPQGSERRVLVNGENIPLISRQPYIIRERNDERSPVILEVTKESNEIIIMAKELGLTLMIEPSSIKIQVPSTLRSKTCGLCGDFNGEFTHEYQGPDMTVYSKPEHFVKHYVIPSRSCEVPTLSMAHSSEDTSRSGSIEEPECVSKRVTIKMPREHMGNPETCFSIRPVHVCHGPCKTLGIRNELIPFHCLPAEADSTKKLEKKMRRTVLNELEGKPVHMRDYINTHDECVPA